MKTCNLEYCNRRKGHDAPHGIELEHGFILAPFGSGEDEVSHAGSCDLLCNCCAAAMTMKQYENGGGELHCTECNQACFFYADKTSSSIVIPKLFPSHMIEGSPLWREFVEYRFSEFAFRMRALTLFRLATPPEAKKDIQNARNQYDEAIAKAEGDAT